MREQAMRNTLLIILLAIYASLANAEARYTIKGVGLYASKKEFLKAFPKAKCEPATITKLQKCTVNNGTLGELQVDELYGEFFENKLVDIYVSMRTTDKSRAEKYFNIWSSKFRLKYGEPDISNQIAKVGDQQYTLNTWNGPDDDSLNVSITDNVSVDLFSKEIGYAAGVSLIRSDLARVMLKNTRKNSPALKDM